MRTGVKKTSTAGEADSTSQTRRVYANQEDKSPTNLHILIVAGVRHGLDLNSYFLQPLASL